MTKSKTSQNGKEYEKTIFLKKRLLQNVNTAAIKMQASVRKATLLLVHIKISKI